MEYEKINNQINPYSRNLPENEISFAEQFITSEKIPQTDIRSTHHKLNGRKRKY